MVPVLVRSATAAPDVGKVLGMQVSVFVAGLALRSIPHPNRGDGRDPCGWVAEGESSMNCTMVAIDKSHIHGEDRRPGLSSMNAP